MSENNTKIEYGDENDPDVFTKFERSYNFYLFNIEYDIETYGDAVEGTSVNKSGIKFKSNDKEFNYYFVVDKELNKDIKRTDFQSVLDLYHTICVSYPKVRYLSDARKKAIKARLNTYTLEDFKTVFENAEASSFLKGGNDRNWSANFDWLIADKNIAKVLEGNYADKGRRKENVPEWFGQRELDDDEKQAIQRMLTGDQLAEAEQLRKQFESWNT